MNDYPPPPQHGDPASSDAFDRRLRLHYRQSTTQLSARTRAQLQQRLRTAASAAATPGGSRRLGWSLAAACSLALVFGIGQRWQAPEGTTGPRVPAVSSSASGNDQLVATLDETPDLYLWVASGDATAMTSE